MGSSPRQDQQPLQQAGQTPPSADRLRNDMAQLQQQEQYLGPRSTSEGGWGSGAAMMRQKQAQSLRDQLARTQAQAQPGARPTMLGGLPVEWGPGPPGA